MMKPVAISKILLSKFCLLSCFCTFNNRLPNEKVCAGMLTKMCEWNLYFHSNPYRKQCELY